jgi:phosphatidylinositol kinase/protein kinase (PI-3  family)
VPIDFGHAFGSATEILPVPELVPFRMTKQFTHILDPCGIECLLEYIMVHVLSGG